MATALLSSARTVASKRYINQLSRHRSTPAHFTVKMSTSAVSSRLQALRDLMKQLELDA